MVIRQSIGSFFIYDNQIVIYGRDKKLETFNKLLLDETKIWYSSSKGPSVIEEYRYE